MIMLGALVAGMLLGGREVNGDHVGVVARRSRRWLMTAIVVVAAVSASTSDGAELGTGLIAFSSNRDGDYEIYVAHPDGSGLRQLRPTGEGQRAVRAPRGTNYSNPSWSPEPTKLAVTSEIELDNHDIHVIDLHGRQLSRVAATKADEIDPDWLSSS
jgi:Tol biopolymer transport system component